MPTAGEREMILASLRPGDGVIVSFGSKGTQYAHVIGYGRIHPAQRRVRVWRKAMGKWTKPRVLVMPEIVRKATAADHKKYAPDFGKPWDR